MPTTFRLNVSTFGGWESDITGTVNNSAAAPSAPYGGSMASLSYQMRAEKTSLWGRGTVEYRYYTMDEPISVVSYTGNTGFGAELTSRLNVTASVNSLYSPRFAFSLLPVAGNPATAAPPTPLDYGVTDETIRQIGVGGTATFRVSRQSSLHMAVSGNRQRLMDDGVNLDSRSYGGGYSYSFSRYGKFRLGYAQQDSDYPAYGPSVPSKRYAYRSFDVGVDYSKPLSISRRTTFSFGTGTSAIDDGIETFFNIVANASLNHQLGRTWEANLVYARGMGVVAGFAEPFFADSVNANATGHLSRKVSMQMGAGFSNGAIGLGSRGEDYLSYQANSRVEWVVTGDRIGVYGEYYYYAYDFGGPTPALPSIPRDVGHHGVRAGLTFRFPLLQERTPRVTR